MRVCLEPQFLQEFGSVQFILCRNVVKFLPPCLEHPKIKKIQFISFCIKEFTNKMKWIEFFLFWGSKNEFSSCKNVLFHWSLWDSCFCFSWKYRLLVSTLIVSLPTISCPGLIVFSLLKCQCYDLLVDCWKVLYYLLGL